MRGRGLEPPRVLPHRILNPARLPVPPPAQTQSRNQNKDNVVAANKTATTAVILLRFLSANV